MNQSFHTHMHMHTQNILPVGSVFLENLEPTAGPLTALEYQQPKAHSSGGTKMITERRSEKKKVMKFVKKKSLPI